MQIAQSLSGLVLLFMAFSFIGWLWELLYNRVQHKRWTNPGFLQGPWVPVYGFGGLLVVSVVAPLGLDPFWTFIVAATLTTTLEYFTHWMLEKLLGQSLWDYTDMPFDIQGRVCLAASLLFGAFSLFAIFTVKPLVDFGIAVTPPLVLYWTSGVLFVLILFDFIWTIASTFGMRAVLPSVGWSFDDLPARLEQIIEDLKRQKKSARQFSRLVQRYTAQRLQRAFPNIGRRQKSLAKKRR